MIDVSGLSKAFGPQVLFEDASLRIGARERIALVGPNGSGKTTLFEMLTGRMSPDDGKITVTRGVTIGYLEQETDAMRGKALIDEVVSSDSETARLQHRLELLERDIAEAPAGPERQRAVDLYGETQDRFHNLGGYSAEAEAKKVLAGLGFSEADHVKATETFSGGWQMRIALAKLLLDEPDLLLLDEPTNHLDLASVEWLEGYLRRYEGAIVMISHDRDLLNGFAERVVEVSRRKLDSYTGNYASFVAQKEEATRQAEKAAKHQLERRQQLERFVARFRYKESKAKQVQSKIKLLDRMQPIEVPREQKRAMGLGFPTPPRPGRDVIMLEGVRFGYPGKSVYEDLDLVIERDQKVALVGPNGAGKSTLLKLLAGVLAPQAGRRRLGTHVEVGYFAQHQIDALSPGNSVIEELSEAVPPGTGLKLRPLLGRFLFSGDDINKKVSVLSGGERTRLAFAKLLVQPFNALCLDEPTNHLDMWSRDVLEDALSAYEGSLVLITHDRHLIRSVADHIIEVTDGSTMWFAGDYEYYLEKRAAENDADEREREPKPKSKPTAAKERRRQAAQIRARTKEMRDEIGAIEAELEALSGERDALTLRLSDPATYPSGEDVVAMSERYGHIKAKIGELERRWDEVTEALARAEAYPATAQASEQGSESAS